MSQKLFKYVTAEAALKILENKTLLWRAPELFNDPFEFKSPFELGFEYEDLAAPLIDAITTLVTQDRQPNLIEDGPTTFIIRNARIEYARKQNSDDFRRSCKSFTPGLIAWLRREDAGYRELWRRFRKQYRVLCLSEVPDNTLMWSHYAKDHSGAVLAFEAHAELRSDFSEAKMVRYSETVPTMATIDQFVAYLTSQAPKPANEYASN